MPDTMIGLDPSIEDLCLSDDGLNDAESLREPHGPRPRLEAKVDSR